jgi:hypothetical protein
VRTAMRRVFQRLMRCSETWFATIGINPCTDREV